MTLVIGVFCARADVGLPNPFSPRDLHISTLPNGTRLVVREDHSLPLVAMEVVVRSGSAAEADTHGKVHYLEHLLFQGTKHYPGALEPQETLEAAGGISNAVTSRDTLRVQGVIPAAQTALLVRVLADVTLAPTLSRQSFAQERAIICAEIQRQLDDPLTTALARAYFLSYRAHPYQNPPVGTITDVLSLTVDDVRAFHARWFVPGNISVVLVGDVSAAEAGALVAKYFGAAPKASPPALPAGENTPTLHTARLHVPQAGDATTQVLALATAPSNSFTAMVAHDVLLTLLAEGNDALLPSWWAQRRVGVQSFGGEFVSSRSPGRMLLWAVTPPAMAGPARDATTALLKQIAGGNVDRATVALAQQRLAMSFLLDNETYSQQAATLAFYEGIGGAQLASRYMPAVQTLTFEQFCAAVPKTPLGWVTVGATPEGE
jgi:zinc protease